eukprot:gene15397-17613_t
MCGRGRFAILAAYEVDEYAQQRPRARRTPKSSDQNSKGGDPPLADPDSATTDITSKFKTTQNLSPGMEMPVIYKSGDGTDSKFVVENMVWGIIPTYLTNPSANDHYRMFNKRIESLERSEIAPYFKTVLQTKRCVVIMDGFYEWKVIAGKKHPHYVSLGEGETMKMAGIYEESNIFDPKIYATRLTKSFSIITGDPCAKFSALHNRMPLLLTDEQALQWLDCPSDQVFTLLNELKKNCIDPSLAMNKTINFYPVTPKVTTASYQEEDCCVYKSIGQTLSNFFKTPYSPPVKAHSSTSSAKSAGEVDNVSEAPTELDEERSASIEAEFGAAESKEDKATSANSSAATKESKQDTDIKTEALLKTELGKRPVSETASSSVPALSPVKKRSLFTQLDAEGTTDSGQEFDVTHTGADASSAINLTMSPGAPPTKLAHSAVSVSNANNSGKTQKAASSGGKNTTAQAKPKPSAVAKKTQASPGMKPITSFFARSPNK